MIVRLGQLRFETIETSPLSANLLKELAPNAFPYQFFFVPLHPQNLATAILFRKIRFL